MSEFESTKSVAKGQMRQGKVTQSSEWAGMSTVSGHDTRVDQGVETEWVTTLQSVTDQLSGNDGSTDGQQRNSQVTQQMRVQSDRVREHGGQHETAEEADQRNRLSE